MKSVIQWIDRRKQYIHNRNIKQKAKAARCEAEVIRVEDRADRLYLVCGSKAVKEFASCDKVSDILIALNDAKIACMNEYLAR